MKRHKQSHWERVQCQARICVRRGWSVLPIPAGRKAPKLRLWPSMRLKEEELQGAFNDTDNIGVLLGEASQGLVDIDLDSPEALKAAKYFLPETGRVHGRAGKPSSHFWYYIDPIPAPAKFSAHDGTVIVECRSNGQQTLIPPSRHPSGDRYCWERTKPPARLKESDLLMAVSRLAACALVARHWPRKGARHEVALALAGFLLRNDWQVEDAKNFVTAAAFASMGDEEWKTRQEDVETTFGRLAKGLSATGIPRLSALIGDDVVSKLADWLGISTKVSTYRYDRMVPSWPERPSSDAFHGLAGEIVSMIEPHSEADPVALLSQFLVGFGNVIGRSAHIRVEADQHFTNLFAVLVGATSKARKGSSLSQVKRLLREADQNWVDVCLMSGLASGEGLIWGVRDTTYSKDGEKVLDAGVEDKRILAVEPEIAQQLKLMAREGNILSTVIRQAWDGGNLRTLTKNSPAQATDAHVSIIGHITQQELRRYLNETELANGFGNRFLWLCVKRSKVLPEGGRIDDDDLSQITQRLTSTINWSRKIKEVRRTAKARQLWSEVYPELSEGKAGLMGAVTSRGEAQVVRLAVIYALLDRSSRIQTKHLEAALALWDYAQGSARFIFGDSLGDPTADEILQALRVSQSGLTRTAISNLFGGHRKSADISRALVVLAQSALASCRPEPTGGRPDELWFVLTEAAKKAKKEE
jgi:Bifunctional DNA primase/polymerase, N-terminal/Protein of unknown function (DUF3987)